MTALQCTLMALQVKVVGPKYGMWGLRKYGTTLKNIDCLEFWPERLHCLSDLIQQEQEAAKKLAVPAAFVTFKSVQLLVAVYQYSPVFAPTHKVANDCQSHANAFASGEPKRYAVMYCDSISSTSIVAVFVWQTWHLAVACCSQCDRCLWFVIAFSATLMTGRIRITC